MTNTGAGRLEFGGQSIVVEHGEQVQIRRDDAEAIFRAFDNAGLHRGGGIDLARLVNNQIGYAGDNRAGTLGIYQLEPANRVIQKAGSPFVRVSSTIWRWAAA